MVKIVMVESVMGQTIIGRQENNRMEMEMHSMWLPGSHQGGQTQLCSQYDGIAWLAAYRGVSGMCEQGILFFELFNPVVSATERMHALSGLRHRILPLDLLQHRPQEAAFVTSLLHPDPRARPTAAQLMQSNTLSALQRSICSAAVPPPPL